MEQYARVARALARRGQPKGCFEALDAALAAVVGHRLFTVLLYHEAEQQTERFYTNHPDAYPVGGRKAITPSDWTKQLYQQQEPFIGYTADDIRRVFFDHETILGLGCESVLNIPVTYDGRTLGTLNLLHATDWYQPQHIEPAIVFAALAVPTYLELLEHR